MKTYTIPDAAKACVLLGNNQFEIKDVPVPTPGFQEVLCKIRAVAICGSDPEVIRGDLEGFWPPAFPFIAGHEWAGEVVAVGKGVTDFQVGDRVAGEAHKGCGVCENCLKGKYNICLNYGKPETGHEHYGFRTSGAYAQYEKYSIKSIKHMPDNVSFEEGSMVDTTSVALHCIELCGITSGGTVAVIGPGPIGLSVMLEAKALGASRLIMVGRGARLQKSLGFGATDIVDFTSCDPVEAVLELTNGVGADQVYECSGAPGTFNQAVHMVRRGGDVGLVGVAKKDVVEPIPFGYVTSNEVQIHGSKANPNVSAKVLHMMSSGQLNVRQLISHRFDLSQFGDALDTFVGRKGGAVKVVIFPNGITKE